MFKIQFLVPLLGMMMVNLGTMEVGYAGPHGNRNEVDITAARVDLADAQKAIDKATGVAAVQEVAFVRAQRAMETAKAAQIAAQEALAAGDYAAAIAAADEAKEAVAEANVANAEAEAAGNQEKAYRALARTLRRHAEIAIDPNAEIDAAIANCEAALANCRARDTARAAEVAPAPAADAGQTVVNVEPVCNSGVVANFGPTIETAQHAEMQPTNQEQGSPDCNM